MCDVVCSICWENVTKNDQLLATTCGHIFHGACIQNWLKQSATCPQCRAESVSPQAIYLTFEDATHSLDDSCAASAPPLYDEENQNLQHYALKTKEDLQLEIYEQHQKHETVDIRRRGEIDELKKRLLNLEILLEEATAKEKTLNEEFHYKLQDLNTEFHYKYQDLKKSKDELQENLSLAKNSEGQLRNSLEEARHNESQLRKRLQEYSNKVMDLESEKAELQSKLEAAERSSRWLKQNLDEVQSECNVLQIEIMERKSGCKEKGDDHVDVDIETRTAEEKKRKLEDKLNKLRAEIKDLEEKDSKLRAVKKDLKKCSNSSSSCSLV